LINYTPKSARKIARDLREFAGHCNWGDAIYLYNMANTFVRLAIYLGREK